MQCLMCGKRITDEKRETRKTQHSAEGGQKPQAKYQMLS